MLTNCLAACAHLTVSEIQRDICEKIGILSHPLHTPLGRFPSEYRHPIWYGKTRVVLLPDGEKISKISLFVLAQLRNVTDRQTDGHRVTATAALCIASHYKNWRTWPGSWDWNSSYRHKVVNGVKCYSLTFVQCTVLLFFMHAYCARGKNAPRVQLEKQQMCF